MFANACSIAREFTFPIIISYKQANGECFSIMGSFVVINDDGWFVTAHHIISQLHKMRASYDSYHKLLANRKSIDEDQSLIQPIKKKQLAQLKIEPTAIENFSIWLGWDNVTLDKLIVLPQIDLAVGRLKNFDKTKIRNYPLFKDPEKTMEQGTSLCKIGFPFHVIKPVYEENKGFILPKESFPPPFFPLEGMFTRNVSVQSDIKKPYPLMYIETSSPGLRGQSGGPTFDIHGVIWAIQSQTHHLKLSFGDSDANSKVSDHIKHQYLNVGWGIHAKTLIGFFKEHGIPFQLSTY